MKKKLLSIVLCAVMLFSLVSNAFAAEDSELTRVVKLAKGRLQIPEEFTEFYSNASNAVGQKSYSLSWSTKDSERRREISVSILSGGEILSYNYYDSGRDYGKKGFAPYSREEYAGFAKEWISRVNPSYVAELAKEYLVNTGNIHSDSVSVNIDRIKDGIKVDGNYINMTLDKYTGEILSMYSYWTREKEVKSPEGVITLDEAAKILGKAADLKLRYYKLRDENRAVLMYAPENSYMMIDAFTGEDFEVEFIDAEIEEGASGGGGAMMAPSVSDSATNEKAEEEVVLTDKELDGINELESLLTKAELTAIIRKMANTEIANFDVKTVNYRRVATNDEHTYYATVRLAKDDDKSGTITFDANTGELISFSTYMPYRFNKRELIKPERMESNALQFIRTWASDIIENVKNFNENQISEYFTFTHNENGIEYRGNRINMRVDNETGKILSYSKNWDKAIVFDSSEGILTEDEVTAKYTEAAPPELLYIANKRVRYASNNAEELALIYRLPDDAPQYIDAKTGDAYDWNMGQTQEESPDAYVLQNDLRGHWAESIVKTLAENGIILSYEETFRPDEAITQKEIAILIDCFQGGVRPYPIAESEYAKYIDRLINRGVIRPNERNPEKKITREETVSYLVRLFGFGEAAELQGIFKTGFSDEAAISADKLGYVAIGKALGLVSGNGGNFNPKKSVTRAELAKMLYNSLVK